MVPIDTGCAVSCRGARHHSRVRRSGPTTPPLSDPAAESDCYCSQIDHFVIDRAADGG